MPTKQELVMQVKAEVGFLGGYDETKKNVENFINAYSRVVEKALAKGEDVRIGDIGILKPVDVAERTGRNPTDGTPIKIPAHKTVRFRISKYLKDKLQ